MARTGVYKRDVKAARDRLRQQIEHMRAELTAARAREAQTQPG